MNASQIAPVSFPVAAKDARADKPCNVEAMPVDELPPRPTPVSGFFRLLPRYGVEDSVTELPEPPKLDPPLNWPFKRWVWRGYDEEKKVKAVLVCAPAQLAVDDHTEPYRVRYHEGTLHSVRGGPRRKHERDELVWLAGQYPKPVAFRRAAENAGYAVDLSESSETVIVRVRGLLDHLWVAAQHLWRMAWDPEIEGPAKFRYNDEEISMANLLGSYSNRKERRSWWTLSYAADTQAWARYATWLREMFSSMRIWAYTKAGAREWWTSGDWKRCIDTRWHSPINRFSLWTSPDRGEPRPAQSLLRLLGEIICPRPELARQGTLL